MRFNGFTDFVSIRGGQLKKRTGQEDKIGMVMKLKVWGECIYFIFLVVDFPGE